MDSQFIELARLICERPISSLLCIRSSQVIDTERGKCWFQTERMLQPRARAPVEGEAIKWGHWSECSEHCVKVRHRLNCDDILPQLPAKTNLTASQARASGPPFGQQKGASRRSLSKGESLAQKSNQVISYNSGDDEDNKPAEEQDEESILAKADQVDDENYQEDEAGQEAEADMCVLVDPSNTMEEKPCTGGLCRRELPVPLQAPGAVSASSAGQLGAPSSGNKVRARERVSSKQRTVNGYRQEKPARGEFCFDPVWLNNFRPALAFKTL